VTVTDKYRKNSVYRGGLGVIVISNELPGFTLEESDWLHVNLECMFSDSPAWAH
jgi:hypothetical protein